MPRKSTGRPDAKAVRTDEAAVGETAERIKRSVPVRAVVALGLGVIAAIAFLEIADFVREGHSTVLDRAVSLRVHELDSDGMDRVMKAFTVAGEIRAIVILAATLAAVLVWQRARALCFLLIAIVSTSIFLNWLLKTHFHRTRPDLFFEIVAPLSYSFPSGHALISSASYGAMAIVLARLVPRLRWAFYAGAAALVLGIGLSRIYLGVHWATDVLAGYAVGALLLVAFESAAFRVREPGVVRGSAR